MTAKKVIEIIRVSTARQAGDDRASIPAQRTINQRTAQANGLEIETHIEMTDVSGADVMHAPEMHRLIELLRSKRYHGVVAREFTRLMRPENFYDMGLLQEFVDAHAILYLPEGPIDFSSKTGRLMGTIRAGIAGLERTELLERSWSAKEEMRRSGSCPSGHITWPYAVAYERPKDGPRGWHYTHDAEKVRKAFGLFTSGITSFTRIAEDTGLSRTALATILTNPIYMGWRVYDKRRDQSPEAKLRGIDGRQGDRRKTRRPEQDVIRVQVISSPLITDEVFHAAQRIMQAKRDRHWKCRHDAEPRFTYTGFLLCGACQSTVYTQSGRSVKNRTTGETGQYDYYVCSERKAKKHTCRTSYMDRARLEEKLDDLFSERLTDRGYVAELAQEFTRRAKNKNGLATIARLQQGINSLREKRERVIESVIDGMITREDGRSRTMAIDRDIQAAQESLMREAPGSRQITPEQLALVMGPLFNWKFLERDHKRRFLSASVPEIHVSDYKIHGIGVLHGNCDTPIPGEHRGMPGAGQSLCLYESHRTPAYIIAKTPSALYIPLI